MSAPAYGQFHVADPPSALLDLHVHNPEAITLKTTDHETPIAVLDQSDLLAQQIHCSRFIPGCKVDPDGLGSCTAQADMGEAASILPEAEFLAFCKGLISSSYAEHPTGLDEPVKIERAAISFYYRCTHQTGNPAEEWPPTDCGSSGPYIYNEMRRLGVVKGQKLATAGESLISLMQSGGVLMGSPWFYAWEEPDQHGFIDSDGSPRAIQECIASGVAGGHETLPSAIEQLAFLPTGHVDPLKTIIRGRNSWSKSWGDHGCYRIHLSTLMAIGSQCDFRQFSV